jgi:hypothetical protein
MGLNNGAIDIKFFLGNPKGEAAADEIFLDVPDDLHSLSLKTLGMIVWTLEHGYDHSFKGDTDTYICIPRLLASGFEKHDYSGCVQGLDQGRIDAVYGGTGYWLSRRAMEAVVRGKESKVAAGYTEDWWVCQILVPVGIIPFNDPRYRIITTLIGPQPNNDTITCHNAARFPQINLRDKTNLYAMHEKAKGIQS